MKLTLAQIQRMHEHTVGFGRGYEAEIVMTLPEGPVTLKVYNILHIIWPNGEVETYSARVPDALLTSDPPLHVWKRA